VIREYGADALRYTMTRLAPLGNDILYSNEKCELGRNFANKIWNASKFILSNLKGNTRKTLPSLDSISLDLFDKWILTRYNQTIKAVRQSIEDFHFNEATVLLYDFIWDDFCSWYIEVSKVSFSQGTEKEKQAKRRILLEVLDGSLRLLHPFTPFVTERIYLTLPGHEKTIMYAPYPVVESRFTFEKECNDARIIQEVVYVIRNIRGENKIAPSQEVEALVMVENEQDQKAIEMYTPFVEKLAKAKLSFIAKREPKPMEAVGHGKGFDIYISLEGTIDKEKERARFEEELKRLTAQKKATEAKLANPQFVNKAPEAVVAKEKDKLAYYETEIAKITAILESLKG
jgi:valyl-tRNA synthetase